MRFKIDIILLISIFLLSLFLISKFIKHDNDRINRAKSRCKVLCGKTNYKCRNNCFTYEYSGDKK